MSEQRTIVEHLQQLREPERSQAIDEYNKPGSAKWREGNNVSKRYADTHTALWYAFPWPLGSDKWLSLHASLIDGTYFQVESQDEMWRMVVNTVLAMDDHIQQDIENELKSKFKLERI